MKRLWIILLVLSNAAGILAGCTGDGGASAQLTAAEVGESIRLAAGLPGMKPGDQEKLQKLYHIEPDIVEDFILYTASSNVKADELAVIRVKDADKVGHVLDKVQERIQVQTVKFKDYRPEEYYLLDKHILKAKGRFVLFAVSKEADQMERAFDDILK
ncbi:DUF4358 domain-containing protein [Paenibacillus sp. FSL W8-0186]|uniref:DUF4358 domain-containing protein n=1 Tax=Paenibacillus woosongensis TaxID=307580 RepID=A0ABQ4MRE9_9BACL|nr:DUF4358 domain-containing protein [Paenibacillus woosongensis]GIP58514.1 hypothetical protein J15TS10_23280 [Paenibacillus woosongensis]